ncbi:MAG: hypothetical protein ACYTFT_17475, partial [Planctomycetota bacterium]
MNGLQIAIGVSGIALSFAMWGAARAKALSPQLLLDMFFLNLLGSHVGGGSHDGSGARDVHAAFVRWPAQMPRVRFPGIAIEPATAADGRSGIRLTGEAYIHRSKNLPVSIEAIVVKDDDSPIKTNDPAYKRTHGLYGAGMQVRATDEAYWQQLDLFVPTGPMNLSSGEHRVAVNLRSYRGDRIYCGGTPPTFLTINKAPSATRVGGDPSGAGPPEAGSGPSAPRPA